MANTAIKRLLSTGFKTGSGILGAQIKAAQEEEERRRLKNQETMAALLGYSLRGQREAATDLSRARIEELRKPEPEKSDVKWKFDLGPGLKAETTTPEGFKEIAAGLGVDVESLFDRAATEDPYAGVKRTAETPGGRITGPYDEATGAIEAMGGISPEKPIKPTNVSDIYNQAMQLAVISAGGEDQFAKLPLPQQTEKMDFFARQLWEQYNPGVPYKGIEFPEMEQQTPEGLGIWDRVKQFFGGGGGEVAPTEDPEIAKARQALEAGQIDQATFDDFVRKHNASLVR